MDYRSSFGQFELFFERRDEKRVGDTAVRCTRTSLQTEACPSGRFLVRSIGLAAMVVGFNNA